MFKGAVKIGVVGLLVGLFIAVGGPAPAYPADNATITGDSVRIRSVPSLSGGDILGELKKGTRVEVTSETDFLDTVDGYTAPWYELSYGGQTGYVFGRYARLDAGVTVNIGYPTERIDYSNRVARFVRDGLATFGTSQSYIIKRLGQPISSKERKDIEAGATVVNHTLTYDGISLDIYGANGEDGDPFSLTCTTGSYDFGGLRVGSPVADVKRLLGDPVGVEGDHRIYSTILSSILIANFEVQNGKVVEITLSSNSYD